MWDVPRATYQVAFNRGRETVFDDGFAQLETAWQSALGLLPRGRYHACAVEKSTILQVGLGPLGLRAVREWGERNLGRIAAAVDPVYAGKDLRTLEEAAPSLTVAQSLDEVREWDAIDAALVTTRSSLADCAVTFRDLLRRGVSVVSSCEELAYPWTTQPALAQELDRVARESNSVLLGTGINPGFLLDFLPVAMSGVCHTVRGVVAGRVQDATTRRLPFQKKIGATLSPEAFAIEVEKGTLRHVGLPESLHFIASHLSLDYDEWEETLEPVIAERELECALGPIPTGHAAGVRQVATGKRGGEEILRLEFQAAIGQAEPRDWITLDADPPLHVVIEGGVHGDAGTISILLNAIPAVLEARPGLLTMADLRPPRCQGRGRA